MQRQKSWIVLLLSATFTLSAHAGILGGTITAGDNITPGGTYAASNTDMYFLAEQSGFLVGAGGIGVDIDFSAGAGNRGAGPFTDAGDFGYPLGTTIAEGTVVNTYLLYHDAVNGTGVNGQSGTVTFSDEEIIGVQGWDNGFTGQPLNLNDGDALFGVAGATYVTSNTRKIGNADSISVSLDGMSIDFFSTVELNTDYVRVITTTVPTPPSLALGFLGAAGILLGRRRRQALHVRD